MPFLGAARVGPEVNGAGLLLWWSVRCQGCVVEVCCTPSRIGFCRWWRAAVQGVLGESAGVDVAGRDVAARSRCCRPGERRAVTGLILAGAPRVPGGFGVGRYRCSSLACGFGLLVCGFGLAYRVGLLVCGFGLLVCGFGPVCRFGLVCRCRVSSGFCPGCGLGARCASRPARGGCLAGRYRATDLLSAA